MQKKQLTKMGFKNQKIRQKLLHSFGKLKEDGFSFELIEPYFRKKKIFDSMQVISDKTWNDLDLQDFFMFADRTVSAIGQKKDNLYG